MIGHAKNTFFSLSLIGSLVLPTFGEGPQYLRRKTNSFSIPEKCTPLPISKDDYEYNSKVYVLLELEESRENNGLINPYPQADIQSLSRLVELDNGVINPNPQDIQSIARAFVGTYDYLTPCDTSFGAEHYIVSANIVDGIEAPASNLYNLPNNYIKGSFTRLIEITMSCNSCGNEVPWQLFEGTRVGVPAAVSLSKTLNTNECVCDGPVQTDFLNKFKQLIAKNKSDVSVLNAIQIPLLVSSDGTYNEELCSTAEEYSTTYNYDGVCLAKPTESPSSSPSIAPSDSPTTASPTDSPTESPTEFPTDLPTEFPTSV